MRPSGRKPDQLRDIQLHRHYTKHAEGSVLVAFGDTKVLCNASITDGVPKFLKGKKQGWLTAEYSMLPRATHTRSDREASRGKQSGRTQEIQRLIGRALRACIDLKKLGEYTITIDCDVIQADGGTRTAAVTGACVAVVDALRHMQRKKIINNDPFIQFVAATSVGIYCANPIIDLDYNEDVVAETDMNVIMNEAGQFIEVQGTAESAAFSREELNSLLHLAETGIQTLIEKQKQALAE